MSPVSPDLTRDRQGHSFNEIGPDLDQCQNALSIVGEGRPGMTTEAIADITGRQHNDVLKKARKFLKDIEATVGRAGNFAGTPLDAQEATVGGQGNFSQSSLEIAEITGKDHKNVLRGIKKMAKALESRGSDLSCQIIRPLS